MKRFTNYLIAAIAAITVLPSCTVDDNNPPYAWFNPNMIVTVKSGDNGNIYFQLDEKTTLLPVNIKPSSYKTPVRALASCEFVDKNAAPYDKAVEVHWLEPVLTKAAVKTEGSASADEAKYGKDPIEIIDSWVSIVEDGYLTLNFVAYFGVNGPAHYINLITGVDPEDPYTVELRHDAKGDMNLCEKRSGVAAFDITSLPDTKGETVKLKVRYKGFSNDKVVEFNYCTGRDVKSGAPVPSSVDRGLSVK